MIYHVTWNSKKKENSLLVALFPRNLTNLCFILQECRIGREPSNSYGEENRDFARKVGDKQLGEGASDTSEGDGSRNNHRPTMRR